MLNQALEREPDNAVALRMRGVVYARGRSFDKGLADAAVCGPARSPGSRASCDRRGAYLKGDRDEAIAALTRAIELDGGSVYALNLRAFAYLERGDSNAALVDLEKAMDMAPRSAGCSSGSWLRLRAQGRVLLCWPTTMLRSPLVCRQARACAQRAPLPAQARQPAGAPPPAVPLISLAEPKVAEARALLARTTRMAPARDQRSDRGGSGLVRALHMPGSTTSCEINRERSKT